MAKKVTPKDPQATEAKAKSDRGAADRKTQVSFRGRKSARKTSAFCSGR